MKINTVVVQIDNTFYYLDSNPLGDYRALCSTWCKLKIYDPKFCEFCMKLKGDTDKGNNVYWRNSNE